MILGEAGEVTSAVAAALHAEGYRVRQVIPGESARQVNGYRYQADLSSPDSLRELHGLLAAGEGGRVGFVINMLGLCPPEVFSAGVDEETALQVSTWTFNTVKEFAEELNASAREGGGFFISFTGLGGQLGLDGRNGGDGAYLAAGTLGIAKTLAREYPRLAVRNVDVDPSLPSSVQSTQIIQELFADDGVPEVGLTAQGRWRLTLKHEPYPASLPPLPLDRGSVVLVTGGAQGITAGVARALASATQCRLVLVGRSPLVEEAAETRGLDVVALRQHFIARAKATGGKIVPAEIERSVGRILKDRQIRANLDACIAAGSEVEYHSLDVRDGERFAALIDDLYTRLGRIDGVVHGAGVIEDKKIGDKTLESFANVFRTKANGALTLARKLRPEGLRFLVFFSSVSGRFGNAGQVDYSAANELLNKLACRLASRWPGQVVSLGWGPWDGGMISDELRKLYAAAGVQLVPFDEGIQSFLSELRLGKSHNPEIILSGSVERMAQTAGGHQVAR